MQLSTFDILLLDLLIIAILGWRIIRREAPIKETLYWLAIIVLIPVFGGILFVVLNEKPLGRKRLKRLRKFYEISKDWKTYIKDLAPSSVHSNRGANIVDIYKGASRHLSHKGEFPALHCKSMQLITTETETKKFLISDINSAEKFVFISSYLWVSAGDVLEVESALIQATLRGVKCKVLIDDLGSTSFLDSEKCQELRKQNIEICGALKAGVIEGLFRRVDIRNHRKIFVIDGKIAYSGSMNIVTSTTFKPWHEDIPCWVDMMIRVEGDAAIGLQYCFVKDWYLETGEYLGPTKKYAPIPQNDHIFDSALIQTIPTGVTLRKGHIYDAYLNFIFNARNRITITSPYLPAPEELIRALCLAAQKGVEVNIITTSTNDAKVVQMASEFNYKRLHEAGVNIFLYKPGLLHAKSLVIDNNLSMVGSLNFDERSFFINFEICNFVYDEQFTAKIDKLHRAYQKASIKVDETWLKSNKKYGAFQSISRLITPLL